MEFADARLGRASGVNIVARRAALVLGWAAAGSEQVTLLVGGLGEATRGA
jgi:hypothetical protein